MAGAAGNFVVLGKVVDAYGLRGALRIHPFGDDPLSWKAMPVWWLLAETDDGDWQPFKLRRCRMQGDALIAGFDGIDDRTQAESCKGWLVGVPREALPATASDEYYWVDLIGLEVVNEQGACLGRVEGLLETGANAVLRVVDAAGSERLLPFVAAVVTAVDKAAGQVRVDWGADW